MYRRLGGVLTWLEIGVLLQAQLIGSIVQYCNRVLKVDDLTYPNQMRKKIMSVMAVVTFKS